MNFNEDELAEIDLRIREEIDAENRRSLRAILIGVAIGLVVVLFWMWWLA